MIGKIFKLAGLSKVVATIGLAMLAGLLGSGYLLKQSYKDNGILETEIDQWRAANNAWSESWQQRETEYNAAMNRLAKREKDYQTIKGDLDEYQEKLRAVLRDSAANDCGVRPSVWLLIKDSAAAGSLPGD